MNLSCYIADDERHAIEVLETYVRQTPELVLSGTATKAEQALADIRELRPAITFLDIDMPRINGLQIAEEIKELTQIILTTSYREYGPEAYETGVADYLLKPISCDRFKTAIERVRQTLQKDPGSTWLIKSATTSQVVPVEIAKINYICGALNYVEIYLPGQKILTYLTLNEIMAKLPGTAFSRIHKSYIVHHNAITAQSASSVRLTDNTILPIGRTFRAAFREKMNGRLFTSGRLGT